MVGEGIGVFIALAGFIFELAGAIVELAGFMLEFIGVILLFDGAVVLAGAIVLAGVTVLVEFDGLAFTLTLVPESPQAMPRALNPRTVESTITFVILITDSYLSQSINILFPGVRLIKHSRFALNSFLFKANVNIVIAEAIVNQKTTKTHYFLRFFLPFF